MEQIKFFKNAPADNNETFVEKKVNQFLNDNQEIIIVKDIKYSVVNTEASRVRLWTAMVRYELIPQDVESIGEDLNSFHYPNEKKLGVINSKDEVLIHPKYDSIWSYDDNGLCQVRNGDLYGMINVKGKEQIPIVYDHIYSFENGVTIVKQNGFYGIIDERNHKICDCVLDYEDVRGFRNGYAPAKKHDLWGAIDSEGKEVVPCKYDTLFYFYDGKTAEVVESGVKKVISL